MKKILISFILIFINCCLVAQDEIWYFGGASSEPGPSASINFTSGTAVPNTGVGFSIYEAITLISDGNGNVLFSSDGTKIFDASNNIMHQGDLLWGSQESNTTWSIPASNQSKTGSSPQGVVSFQAPGSDDQFYIFTINDVLNPVRNGLRFNRVDMSQQGGLGSVVEKNVEVIPGATRTSEMMVAMARPCSDTVWVVVHGQENNLFYSVPVSPSGVGTPVISTVGPVVNGDQGRGSLALSSDASLIAMGGMLNLGAWIFNFDSNTGQVTSSSFGTNNDGQVGTLGCYGACFSPDNQKVYFSSQIGNQLMYCNLTQPFTLGTNPYIVSTNQLGGIRVGPDGIMYFGKGGGTHLATLTDPNADSGVDAQASYSSNGLDVGVRVNWGLPNLFVPLSANDGFQVDITQNDSTICDTTSAFNMLVNSSQGNWSSNPIGLIDESSGLFNPNEVFDLVGDGGVVQIIYGGSCLMSDTINLTLSECNSCPDTTLSNTIDTVCIDETVDLTIYEVTSDAGTWSIVNTPSGSSPATILPGGSIFDATNADPGIYRIRFTLDSIVVGCPDSSERDIIVNAKPAISLTGGSFCAGDSLLLDAGNIGATYQWSNGRINQTEYFSTEGPHKVIVTISGCIDSAQVTLTVNDVPSVSITAPDVKCTNDSIKDLAASPLGGQWYLNGDTLSSAILNPESIGDTSFVLVYEYTDGNGCSGIDTLLDTLYQSPEITEMPDLGTVCSSQSPFKLMALPSEPEGKWYINGDSLIGDTLYPDSLSAGVFDVVYVYTNIDGCSDSDTSSLIINDVLDVKIDSILSNCDNQGIDTLEASAQGGQWYINNDSIYSAVFNTDSLGEGSHLVKYVYSNGSGCSDSDSVTVTIYKAPTVDLGPDTFFCAGSSIELNAGSGFSDYKWTPIGSGSTNIVDSSGDISVVVIDNNGCSDTSQVTITQKELPEVDLGDMIYVCEDDSLTLYAVEPDSSSYSWLPNNEKTDTLRIGSDNELYIVTITDTTNGCQFIDSVQILEDVPPKIDLGGDDKICDDSLKTLEAGFFSGVSYEWYLDYELIPDQTAQKLEADSGIYRVKLITENGCKSSDTVYIDNHQLPIIVLNDEYEFCELDSIEIDLGSGPIGFSYLWSTGDSTQSIWVKSEEIISVEVTDTNTCTNSATIIVKENLLPLINLAGSDSACEGREILLDVEIPNGILYEWSNGHNDSEYTLVGPDTLQVKITTDKNCVDSATIEVKELPPLDLSDIGDTNKVCFQSEEDNPINAGYFEDAEYLWALPDGTTETGNSIVPLLDGWYTVNVTDRFSCKGQDSIFNIVLPIPNINLGPDKSFCSLGLEVDTVRMNFSQNTSGTITWEAWDDKGNVMENNISDNDTLFITEIAPIFISGLFVDNSGCSNTDTVHLNEKCEPTVLTFPNVIVPNGNTNTTFRPIELTDEVLDKLLNNILWSKFEVYNRWGYRLFQSENILPRWDGVFENRPVSTGTYYWIFKYEDSSVKIHSLNGFVEVVHQ